MMYDRMKVLKTIIFLFFLLVTAEAEAQEFNCSVSVSSPEVEGTDRNIYNTLQRSLYEFINQRKWTNYVYTVEERIECTMMITIKERISTDEFKAQINVQLRRPVYKTSYNSVLLNYIDKDFTFRYLENQTLDYSDNAFASNLTSVVAFYCYILLGLDFDSFTPNGGTPYYEKAQAVVNAAQNAQERGWKAFESLRNRYWMAENLLNPSYSMIRDFYYNYHRLGLDQMSDNLEIGRSEIANCVELLRKASREKPDLFILRLVLEAKSDELVNVFSQASPMDKTKVVNILNEIDPANAGKYQKIMENK
jgi:hypothetical protein